MTYMQKEYEVKITNGTGSMTTAKKEVLNWLLLKNGYSVGTMNLWWWCVWGVWFSGGILTSEGDFPPSPK